MHRLIFNSTCRLGVDEEYKDRTPTPQAFYSQRELVDKQSLHHRVDHYIIEDNTYRIDRHTESHKRGADTQETSDRQSVVMQTAIAREEGDRRTAKDQDIPETTPSFGSVKGGRISLGQPR